MPVRVDVSDDQSLIVYTYQGDVGTADVERVVRQLADGTLPTKADAVHDFRDVGRFVMPSADSVRLSFERRQSLAGGEPRQVRIAFLNASSEILDATRLWRVFFQGDESLYRARVFSSREEAEDWLGKPISRRHGALDLDWVADLAGWRRSA